MCSLQAPQLGHLSRDVPRPARRRDTGNHARMDLCLTCLICLTLSETNRRMHKWERQWKELIAVAHLLLGQVGQTQEPQGFQGETTVAKHMLTGETAPLSTGTRCEA